MTLDIDRLNEAELVELNNKIVARLRFLAEMRAHAAMMKFNIGNRVSFQPPNQPVKAGILTRYNKKSVTVITDDGQQWNVAPSLLQKAETGSSSKESGENVISLHKI